MHLHSAVSSMPRVLMTWHRANAQQVTGDYYTRHCVAVFRFLFSHDKTPQLLDLLISQVIHFGREGIYRKILFALMHELLFATERWDDFTTDQMSFVSQH